MGAAAAAWGAGHLLDRRLDELSRGQAQCAALAMSLAGDAAEVVLLDEPAAWLDPDGRSLLRRGIEGLRERGATVVVSSHDLAELERVADEVLFFREGRPAGVETLDRERVADVELVVSAWPAAARERWPAAHPAAEGDRFRVRLPGGAGEDLAGILAALVEMGVAIHAVRARREGLEEAWHEHLAE